MPKKDPMYLTKLFCGIKPEGGLSIVVTLECKMNARRAKII